MSLLMSLFMPICLCLQAYGAEAGVAALKWLPYGGLYLTGGLTPKNVSLLQDPSGPFMTALLDKGRVSGMLCSIPVFAVMVEDLGERGAKYMALHLLKTDLTVSAQSVKKARRTEKKGRGDFGWTLTAAAIGASAAVFLLTTLRLLHHKK
ncbi:hypothetical protein EON64_20825 [archaeon]|nr:MAG: hypothetical protein EON64_20825 [archaeon]